MNLHVLWKPSRMRKLGRVFLIALAGLGSAIPALADREGPNTAHDVAGPSGRCYAKSVPMHVRDPQGEPRQQGTTTVYRVGETADVLVQFYDWFSQQLFVKCGPIDDIDDILVVRLGPWHRGHEARADHLALAFYRAGALLKSYSTLDISGTETVTNGGISRFKNVSASVSHYTVFESGPDMIKVTSSDGPDFIESWFIKAVTIDGRSLMFDMETGEVQ